MEKFIQLTAKFIRLDKAFFIFIGLTTLLVYSVSFGNEFISDDTWGIRDNPSLANIGKQLQTLNIKEVIFSLIYNVFGPVPFWFHIHNSLVHIVSIFLVYALVYLLKPNRFIARLTTILFALHPIETEAVTWISGAPYAIVTLTQLTALILFIGVDRHKISKRWLLLSILLYALSVIISLTSYILPLILATYLWLFSRIHKPTLRYLIPYTVVMAAYSARLYFQITDRVQDIYLTQGGTAVYYNPFWLVPTALGKYIQLMLLPYNLTLYHDFVKQSTATFVGYCVITILLAGGIFGGIKYNKLASFGLIFFIIALAPTLIPLHIAWIVAERYVHFGSIGFFLSVSAVTYALIKRFAIPREQVLMGTTILVLILSIVTIKRNLDWRNQDALWPITVKYSPYNAHAWNNMGDYYGRRGDYANAIVAFERARLLSPRFDWATHNLANIYYLGVKDIDTAQKLYLESTEYNPTLYLSYQRLAQIELQKQNPQKAEEYIKESIKHNPNPFYDYVLLAQIYKAKDDIDAFNKLKAELEVISQSDPSKQQALESLIRP